MNVLIITGIFPPDIGGPASYVPAIAAALRERRHFVSVITLSDTINHDDSIYTYPIIRILRSTFKPWRLLKTIRTICSAGRQADVLFIHGLALEATIANLILKKPLVQKVVGDFAWERASALNLTQDSVDEFQRNRYGIRVEWLKKLRTFWVKQSDAVIIPCAYFKPILQKWGVPEQKIIIIYNADIKITAVYHDKPQLLQQLDTTQPVLVAVGRLYPYKNFDAIIKTMHALPEAHLFIIGDGPMRLHLEKLIADEQVQDRVHLTGSLPRADVFSFLSHADLFILNSTHETFPHVVLEAFHAGTPVIATNTGGTPEIIRHGYNGILIPPGNPDALKAALQEVLHNRDMQKTLVAQGRETLKNFNWTTLVEQTELILQKCAERHFSDIAEDAHDKNGVPRIPVLFVGSTRFQIPPDPALRKKWNGLAPHFRAEIIAFYEGSTLQHYCLEGSKCILLPSRLPRMLRYAVHGAYSFFLSLSGAILGNYRAIIAQSPFEAVAPALALVPWKMFRAASKPKLIVEIHNDWKSGTMLYHHGSSFAWLENPVRLLAGNFSLSQADAYRVISEYCRTLVPDGRKPVFTFPTFTDLAGFQNPSPEVLQEVSAKIEKKYFMYAGMLIYLKGIHILLHSFKDVLASHANVQLIIAGKGAYESELKNLAERLGIAAHTVFTGHLEQSALAAYIKNSVALILPSLTEGLGRVVIEAQLLERPVIASRTGGIPEIIENTKTGVLIEPGDTHALAEAMKLLLDNPPLVEQMGRRGREQVLKKFNYQHYFEMYRTMVQSVCSE